MGRLINADTIVHYQTYDDEHEEFSEHESTIEDFLDEMTDEGCPKTVDAVPVRHGRWITHEVQINGYAYAICECTVCGARRPTILFPLAYCPNCDARMDGKGGEQT